MESKKEAEKQRADLYQAEMEKLHHRIAELEMFNQESENLVGEKQKQLEYELELKDQKISAMHE